MRPLVVLVEFLAQPSVSNLIAANAKASLTRSRMKLKNAPSGTSPSAGRWRRAMRVPRDYGRRIAPH